MKTILRYYDVVSMTLNVARVRPPAGVELPFEQAGHQFSVL
jgi:4-carboxymuconolactone decarboxylase